MLCREDYEMPVIISPSEARALGLKRYFTGKPCKHGHVAERKINGNCVDCSREYARYAADPERHRKYHRKYRAKNLEKAREYQRKWRAAAVRRRRAAAKKAAQAAPEPR